MHFADGVTLTGASQSGVRLQMDGALEKPAFTRGPKVQSAQAPNLSGKRTEVTKSSGFFPTSAGMFW